MDENFQKAFELAAAVYRLAKLCPEGEILVSQMKKRALDILADFIKKDFVKTMAKIEVLQSFFNLAQLQNWVNSANFEVLDKAYQGLKKSFGKPKIAVSSVEAILNERQEQILKFLASKKKFRLKEVKKKFSQVSDKTLRNDLKVLAKQKFIKRQGRGAGSIYNVIR